MIYVISGFIAFMASFNVVKMFPKVVEVLFGYISELADDRFSEETQITSVCLNVSERTRP